MEKLKNAKESNLVPRYEVFEKYVGEELNSRFNIDTDSSLIKSISIESGDNREIILESGYDKINEKILYAFKPRLIKDLKTNSISLYLGDTFICKCNR